MAIIQSSPEPWAGRGAHAGRPHARSIPEGGSLAFGDDCLARKFLSTSNLNLWLYTLCLLQSNGGGPAHHGSVILGQRARGVGEIGKVGVNGGHRLDSVMEEFGVFIIRDLEGTNQGVRRWPPPLSSVLTPKIPQWEGVPPPRMHPHWARDHCCPAHLLCLLACENPHL